MVRFEDRWDQQPSDRLRPQPISDRKSSREQSPPRTPRSAHFAQDRDRRQYARHSYDAEYKKSAGRPFTDHSSLGRRQSWPPSPLVEDEKISLAKEANPFRGDWDEVDPSIRGSLDQTPIILELDDSSSTPSEPNIKKPRSTGVAKGDKKGRPNAPKSLGSDFLKGTPEIASRTPSTYAFTPKARTPDARDEFRSHHDSGYFSTNDSRTPSSSDRKKEALARGALAGVAGLGVEAITSDALRGLGKTREATRESSHHQRRPSGPISKESSVVSDASSASNRTSRPRLAELKAEALHSNRRSTESATSLPQPDFGSRSPNNKTPTSRPASPSSSPAGRFPPSPPRSPKHSPHQSREDLARYGKPSSVSSSRTNSRPSSPKPYDGVPEPLKRASTIPSIPDDRTQRTSRLASSQSINHDDPRTPRATPTALPYPVDDMNLMPSEDDHRYKPRGLGIEEHTTPSIPTHKLADRPRLDSRHTYGGKDAPIPPIATGAAAIASPHALNSPWSDASGSAGRGPRAPPPCPRSFATRGHDDWLTLDNLPDFDICPSCYEANFAHGPFHKSFKRVHHSPKEKLRCDFSSSWIRVAWLLTLKQHRWDLDLIYGVARAGAREHCSGNEKETRVWYTVRDSYDQKVDDFHVCHADVKRIEALLPSMDGLFTRAYHGQPKKRVCCFRTESKRFQEYLDHLIELDDMAGPRKQPEWPRFANLVRQKAQMRECSRDDMVPDMTWHYARELPEFTVCEECYSDVVWPAIADGSTVASRIHRTPQPSHRERRGSTGGIVGTSCQLYSPRMRRVFKKAVQLSDFGLLAHRAQERKDAEEALQERFASLRRLSADTNSKSSNAQGLQLEYQRLKEEWSRYE